jgi:hypothetical protein
LAVCEGIRFRLLRFIKGEPAKIREWVIPWFRGGGLTEIAEIGKALVLLGFRLRGTLLGFCDCWF